MLVAPGVDVVVLASLVEGSPVEVVAAVVALVVALVARVVAALEIVWLVLPALELPDGDEEPCALEAARDDSRELVPCDSAELRELPELASGPASPLAPFEEEPPHATPSATAVTTNVDALIPSSYQRSSARHLDYAGEGRALEPLDGLLHPAALAARSPPLRALDPVARPRFRGGRTKVGQKGHGREEKLGLPG